MYETEKIEKKWKTLLRILDCAEYNQILSLLATKPKNFNSNPVVVIW
jgi:hypothetical protein